jgi:hypothetical protein
MIPAVAAVVPTFVFSAPLIDAGFPDAFRLR